MARKGEHVSETPATAWLRRHGVAFTEHVYDYVEHGGTAESSRQLGVPEHEVVKTLVMQDEDAKPLVVLMHGDREVSTKNLARQIDRRKVEPCRPGVAQRHSGYLVGGTSPFATKKAMPVYVEASVLELPRICINGGRRGSRGARAPDGGPGRRGAPRGRGGGAARAASDPPSGSGLAWGGPARRPGSVRFEAETRLQRDLPMRDLAVGDLSARLDDFEPVEVAQRLAGGLDRVADRVVDARRRRADEFDHLVDMVGHAYLLRCRVPSVHPVRGTMVPP